MTKVNTGIYGTCQLCAMRCDLNPDGTMPNHGHRYSNRRMVKPPCAASGSRPLEVSDLYLTMERSRFEQRAAEYTTSYPNADAEQVAKNAAWCAREIAFLDSRIEAGRALRGD